MKMIESIHNGISFINGTNMIIKQLLKNRIVIAFHCNLVSFFYPPI